MSDDGRTPYGDSTIFTADRPADGVLRLWLDTGHPGNRITHENHREFSTIWSHVAEDDDTNAVVVRGTGGTLCSGGDMSFMPPLFDDADRREEVRRDIVALVRSIVDCPKPVVTAIEGLCSGGGLAMALMADVPVASESSVLIDGHLLAGVACGDHAALAWPLQMGLAKTKYHLLLAEPLTGVQAAASGLVADVVADDRVHEVTLDIATRLASLDPVAVSLTKAAVNGWYQLGMDIFERSAADEATTFDGPGARAAYAAHSARTPDD